MEPEQDVHELFRSVMVERAELQLSEIGPRSDVALELELFQDLTEEDEDRLPTWISRAFSV